MRITFKHILSILTFGLLLFFIITTHQTSPTDYSDENLSNSSSAIIKSGHIEGIESLVRNHFEIFIIAGVILLIILILLNHKRYLVEQKYRMVEDRYKQFELNYRSFIEKSNDMVFIFTLTGIIKQYYATSLSKLYKPPSEFLGKKVEEVLPENVSREFNSALKKCIDENKLTSVEYTLEVPVGELSFEARFARYDENHAIVVVTDITVRKKSYLELQKLLRALEQTMDEIAVSNMEGYIEFANKAWAESHGYTSDELIGEHLSIFHTREHNETQVVPFNNILMEKGFNRGEIDHKRKDGSIYPTFMTTAVIKDENGNFIGMVGIARDITERKQAERAIRKSEGKFRKYIESAPDGIFVVNTEGRYIEVNDAACQMTGYSESELLGMCIPDLVDQNYHHELYQGFEELKRTGTVESEFRLKCKDGTIIWASLHAVSLSENRFMAFCSDITDRKQSVFELQKANDIINNSPVVAFSWRTVEGWPIDHVSENAIELFGYSVEEFISGQVAFSEVIHFDDVERVKAEVDKYCEEKEWNSYTHEPYRIITKDGEIKWVDDMTQIRRDENGIVTHCEGIVYDITDRKIAEVELNKSEEKYRGIFNESIATIYVFDTQKCFLDSNKAGLDLLGYSKEELLKLSIHDVDADPVVTLPNYKELLAGQKLVDFEHNLKRKDGKIITVLNNSIPLTNENGEVIGLQSTLIDITDRKQTEEALIKSELKYSALIETTDTGYLILDEAGLVVDANPEYVRLTGYKSLNDILGRSVIEWTSEDNIEKNAQAVKGCLEQGFIKNLEIDYIDKDGIITSVEINATILETDDGLSGLLLPIDFFTFSFILSCSSLIKRLKTFIPLS